MRDIFAENFGDGDAQIRGVGFEDPMVGKAWEALNAKLDLIIERLDWLLQEVTPPEIDIPTSGKEPAQGETEAPAGG